MSTLVARLTGLPAKRKRGDGFGQSLIADIRYARRFARMKRAGIEWREPTAGEEAEILADPLLGRFADDVFALGEYEDRACVVMERLWHGWPDPPRYVLFVVEDGPKGRRPWAAADFDTWPPAWMNPDAPPRLLEAKTL